MDERSGSGEVSADSRARAEEMMELRRRVARTELRVTQLERGVVTGPAAGLLRHRGHDRDAVGRRGGPEVVRWTGPALWATGVALTLALLQSPRLQEWTTAQRPDPR